MNLTPRQIVSELDKYIIGQDDAKKAVAIALRNRWRRQQVSDDMRAEILPNNIILIGATGVGKTEISRRLAGLDNAPFIKVEASKFTEVGYVGRDVESIVRDLVDHSVNYMRSEHVSAVEQPALEAALENLLTLLCAQQLETPDDSKVDKRQLHDLRQELRPQLEDCELDDLMVELDVDAEPSGMMQIISPIGMEEMGLNIQDLLSPFMGTRRKKRRVKVGEAMVILQQQETEKLIDMEQIIQEAIERVEESGIVFLDEIDKIAGSNDSDNPDVSREGVQRDLLPVIEGTNVITKYGMVQTDHILFIASGAFHMSKPSDLIPELQGRFPIRVEMDDLTKEDFERILTEPRNALIKQYKSLLKSEGVSLSFTRGAISEIAEFATQVNARSENIGARRLHTMMSNLLEDFLFELPDTEMEKIKITQKTVKEQLKALVQDEDLSQYIL
ncbi:MAG: ATP-dependent protease ATPase subunit HslU [candidate division KSB1 bacterium]|nr:ATP-dependent protease ATPase subunit HslU [candidate division KSB1 bacterium]